MIRLSEIIIVAGPNGAGKTSFARQFLPGQLRDYNFINADEIARGMISGGLPRAQVDLRAGRQMLQRIRQAIEFGENVMLETTLSSGNWAKHIPVWRTEGYGIELYYLRLPDPEAAIARVRKRVASGGHDIPEATIRRRFVRSLDLLESVYKPAVDAWYVFDSLEGAPPLLVQSSRS